jgi:hypothetical protein
MNKKNKVFDALDKTFGTLTQVEETKTPMIPVDQQDEQLENDFQEARNALKRAMVYGEEAIQGILQIAQNSDNPRAFEVAGQLIKTMSDQAKDVMDVQERKQKIDKIDGKVASKIEKQTNIVFNGSTSDLLKAINDEQKTIENVPTDRKD